MSTRRRFDLIWSNPPTALARRRSRAARAWLGRIDARGAPARRAEDLGPTRSSAGCPPGLAGRAARVVGRADRPMRLPPSAGRRRRCGAGPFGRSAPMNAAPSRPTTPRDEIVRGPPPTVSPATVRSWVATSSLPGPLTVARAAPAASRAARAPTLRVEEPGGVGQQGGLDHLVVRQVRLDHQPSTTPPRSEQPRRPGEQRHRLFSGTVTRCQQLAIEVQQRDDIGGLDTMEHRLCTDIHVGGR